MTLTVNELLDLIWVFLEDYGLTTLIAVAFIIGIGTRTLYRILGD